MSDRTLENTNAAWVQQDDGSFVLYWLDRRGKPSEPAGAGREIDLPAAHTPGRTLRKQSRPLPEQLADMWPASQ
jgi:hypothetical protein